MTSPADDVRPVACTICHNLLPDTLSVVKPGQCATVFIDEFELVRSALSQACSECRLLYDAISLKRKQWAATQKDSRSIIINVAVGRPLAINWNQAGIFLKISQPRCDGRQKTDQNLPIVIGPAPIVSGDSASESCLSLLSSWYKVCRMSHPMCKFQCAPKLPTRVVDLGHQLKPTADISLVETKGAHSEYMALSYCWGEKKLHPRLKTTRATVDQYKAKIPFSALPLTLQHAVMLVRRLECRYLWIDCLCIIQDDDDDWTNEASKMCDIYSNPALTIAACGSDGCTGGIFGSQQYSISVPIPYKHTFVNVSDDYTRDHGPDLMVNTRPPVDPIHTRAWTLQEGILSTRTVFFTSQELRWECNTRRLCECGHFTKTFPATTDPEDWQYENHRIWRRVEFFPANSTSDAYQLWAYVYNMYTSRELAVDSDRLVALAGLARRFAQIMKARFGRDDKYLAGIWEGSLPVNLLWLVPTRELSTFRNRRHERPKGWRAPSWSWASMEAPIYFGFYRDLESRLEILGSSVEPAGPDIYGSLRPDGQNHLLVLGPLLHQVSFKFDADAPKSQRKFPFLTYRGFDLRMDTLWLDNDLDLDTDKYLRAGGSCFTVLIVGFSPGGDLHEVLILTSVADKSGSFERIALARLGAHMREPEGRRLLLDQAPRETIMLV